MAAVDKIGPLRDSETGPRYMRLQRLIRDAIEKHRIAVGAALPTERELVEEYGVSRVTVRKAVDGLVDEGMLERRQGAGTFVAAPRASDQGQRVEKSFSIMTSFSEDMAARGRKPTNVWIDRSEGVVTPDEAMLLGLSPGSRILRFNRIRCADGETMAIEHAVVPGWALPSPEVVGDSLYAALDAEGHRPVRALQRLRSVGFSPEHAAMLGISAGDPCLAIERRAFLPDGRLVEATNCYYRGDAYDLVVEQGDY
ncbi:GntR family transcriptional regulator [Novosphingobium resinovorum]|uniref:GntR family transcriptional regulator n=1 Tax=Novosphingobium resinovorum TaxID=158500 RepID=A0A031JXW3_9SPHN|nr:MULTISPECIES: GntR family transcriptional regulator [Sphingomonadaceae]AOR79918.1 GntR family transcriptional regulator [Novosphingobium resinovorum]EJU11899.1 GntR family transcriptional regulator [Sphingomonas sp. LH128]EZP81212.1 GntR family transcriptional regulator [Novosphingobium resinovorum]MBF7014955.1 GntR family transcriptional regulator [Novosphingobium sp. HR1a]WJM24570.1 GntR family transcriptional regulator [Novosphingobium resinovorum]